MVINTCPHYTTKVSPCIVVHGWLPYHPEEELIEAMNIDEHNSEASMYLQRLKKTLLIVSRQIMERIEAYQQKIYGDTRVTVKDIPYFHIGEQVWARDHSAIIKEEKYVGPLEIVEHVRAHIVRFKWPKTGAMYI